MHPEIFTTPLLHLASGDWLVLQGYRFVGARPGQKVYVQANLHGAELAGNGVIYELLGWLRSLTPNQLQGEIWLVPVCNPLGVNQRSHQFASGRFNPYDGRDWNRIFWDYEKTGADIAEFAQNHRQADPEALVKAFRQQILQAFQTEMAALDTGFGAPVHERVRVILQSLALDADYLIDLHSSSNRGMDYVYYFRHREETAAAFGLDFGIWLDEYDGDAFDEAFIKPWLALEQVLAEQGRPLRLDIEAWTLELGHGMALGPESVRRGVAGVQAYLGRKGVVDAPVPEFSVPLPLTRRSQIIKYYATQGGMVQQRVPPGTQVQPGDLLFQLLSFNKTKHLPTLKTIEAEQAGLVYDVSTHEAVNQGEYILSLAPIAL